MNSYIPWARATWSLQDSDDSEQLHTVGAWSLQDSDGGHVLHGAYRTVTMVHMHLPLQGLNGTQKTYSICVLFFSVSTDRPGSKFS